MLAIFVLAMAGMALLGILPLQRQFQNQRALRERLWCVCYAQGDRLKSSSLVVGEQSKELQWEGKAYQLRTKVSETSEPGRWLLVVQVTQNGQAVESGWLVRKTES